MPVESKSNRFLRKYTGAEKDVQIQITLGKQTVFSEKFISKPICNNLRFVHVSWVRSFKKRLFPFWYNKIRLIFDDGEAKRGKVFNQVGFFSLCPYNGTSPRNSRCTSKNTPSTGRPFTF